MEKRKRNYVNLSKLFLTTCVEVFTSEVNSRTAGAGIKAAAELSGQFSGKITPATVIARLNSISPEMILVKPGKHPRDCKYVLGIEKGVAINEIETYFLSHKIPEHGPAMAVKKEEKRDTIKLSEREKEMVLDTMAEILFKKKPMVMDIPDLYAMVERSLGLVLKGTNIKEFLKGDERFVFSGDNQSLISVRKDYEHGTKSLSFASVKATANMLADAVNNIDNYSIDDLKNLILRLSETDVDEMAEVIKKEHQRLMLEKYNF